MKKTTYINNSIKHDKYLNYLKKHDLKAYCNATAQAHIYYLNKYNLKAGTITKNEFLNNINNI